MPGLHIVAHAGVCRAHEPGPAELDSQGAEPWIALQAVQEGVDILSIGSSIYGDDFFFLSIGFYCTDVKLCSCPSQIILLSRREMKKKKIPKNVSKVELQLYAALLTPFRFPLTCSNRLVVDFVQDLTGDRAAFLRREVLHNLIYIWAECE